MLNKAIKGLKRLRKNRDFSYQRTWESTMEKYAYLSDPVGTFIEECCRFVSEEEIPKPTLFKAFISYCNEHKIPSGTKQGFGRILKREFKVNITERQNNWQGIALKKLKTKKK